MRLTKINLSVRVSIKIMSSQITWYTTLQQYIRVGTNISWPYSTTDEALLRGGTNISWPYTTTDEALLKGGTNISWPLNINKEYLKFLQLHLFWNDPTDQHKLIHLLTRKIIITCQDYLLPPTRGSWVMSDNPRTVTHVHPLAHLRGACALYSVV